MPAKVFSIEYDPNRSARICLLHYVDGEKRYIIWPKGLKVGDEIVAGPDASFNTGNALPLEHIPLGTMVHNVELNLGKGGQLARSAGSFAQVMAKEGEYVTLRLPSGEVRMVHKRCYATIGEVGNAEHENVVSGKAGRSRWLGHPPDGARRGHEPGRSPARRRRGPHQRRSPPGDALGHADQGLQDAQEEAFGQLHRAAPQGQGLSKGRFGVMARSIKKGPFIQEVPSDQGRGAERPRREAGHQDLVAALDDRPRVPRATRSPCTTASSSCRCTCRRTWSGHKLGEFAPTRTYRGHTSKKK